ncbi:MAG: outer membrane protein assembly factor BamE [Methyloprofundus sp.]|nr:outer membrane protein assembly factor BamE [Methyloprofundus sp.]MBW6453607.1 outer membrane protein assembly factor BamE [Methyloprofundus sp.]
MSQTLRLIILSISLSILTACSTIATDVPLVYEIDIDQGNIIDQLMVNQLRPNMTKRQVIYILGSPLLIDPFTPNRWDYIYSQQPGGEDRTQQRVALLFNGDNLVNIAGDLAPEINPPPPPPKEITVDAPKRELKKTLYEMIVSLFTFED